MSFFSQVPWVLAGPLSVETALKGILESTAGSPVGIPVPLLPRAFLLGAPYPVSMPRNRSGSQSVAGVAGCPTRLQGCMAALPLGGVAGMGALSQPPATNPGIPPDH